MPQSKSGKYFANAQQARAHDSAPPMPRPRPIQKDARGVQRDGDHGGIAKVETIVHHQDGHKERMEHNSAEEAQQHLESLDPSSTEPDQDEAGEGQGEQEEVCPLCHGEDPHCPECDGTGKVPANEDTDSQTSQSY